MTLSPQERNYMRISARPGSDAERLLRWLEAAERERDAFRAELEACKAKLEAAERDASGLLRAAMMDHLCLLRMIRDGYVMTKTEASFRHENLYAEVARLDGK